MEFLTNLNAQINNVVWGVPMLLLLAGTGIFLSFRLRFVQFRKFGFMTPGPLTASSPTSPCLTWFLSSSRSSTCQP